MPKKVKKQKIAGVVVYQAKSGALELRGDVSHETLWATQAQVAAIFGIDRTVATRHIGNILKDREVDQKSNVQKMHIANSDKPVAFYSLDMILAVGYRANTGRAIEFRKWATKILRTYLTKGYTINPKVVGRHYEEFQKAVADIRSLLPAGARVDTKSVLELVSTFADTWLLLDAYDRDSLPKKGATKRLAKLTAEKLSLVLVDFKTELMRKGEATDLFGIERTQGSIEGIVGNVMQAFGGSDLYPTLEEKAAHLLYFLVKNHPFTDGNKRSGAYAFVWFLRSVKLLDTARMTPPALTALTLLVAESNPKDKDKMIRLILALLAKKR